MDYLKAIHIQPISGTTRIIDQEHVKLLIKYPGPFIFID